jgi:two-component system LytT family response regulator
MKTIIIDDEKLARSRLRRMLGKYDLVEIVGEARNGKEALALIGKTRPDVIFLDIRMPLLTGFEMLEKLDRSPYVIFTTAYDQYALQAFEENTVDYLLKPVSEEKLDRAITKVEKILDKGPPAAFDLEFIMQSIQRKTDVMRRFSVKVGDRIYIIQDNEVVSFHAEDKYTFLNTAKDKYIIQFSLKDLESRLDSDRFIRVHRSAIVNIEQIESMHRWFGGRIRLIMANQTEITVSQNYMNRFRDMMHL